MLYALFESEKNVPEVYKCVIQQDHDSSNATCTWSLCQSTADSNADL